MAHETPAPSKKELDFRNGTPVEPPWCEGEDCYRPTTHPSGECTQCREEA